MYKLYDNEHNFSQRFDIIISENEYYVQSGAMGCNSVK